MSEGFLRLCPYLTTGPPVAFHPNYNKNSGEQILYSSTPEIHAPPSIELGLESVGPCWGFYCLDICHTWEDYKLLLAIR
jgi:hypothetical protein